MSQRIRYHSTLREPIRAEGPNDVVHVAWVEETLPGGWTAFLRIIDRAGRPEVAEVRIVPSTPKAKPGRWSEDPADVPLGGVTQRNQLRRVHLEEALQLAAGQGEVLISGRSPFPLARYGVNEGWVWRTSPGGGRRIDDVQLAQLARLYLAITERQHPKPVVELARVTGMPSSRLRDHLRKAKARGLYESRAPGRAGGALTEKGRALLAEEVA